MVRVQRFRGTPEQAEAATAPLQREYLLWWGERLAADHGITFDDEAAVIAAHHHEFTRELPHLLGPRGRLFVATDGDDVVGVGALKPVDADVAEIKRMYVRPQARGRRVGRAILDGLLADARTLGYAVARLETAVFMREAQALYRSLGFRERPSFAGSEAALSGLDAVMLYMELRLNPPPASGR
jgi:ribosomal protein S18 acetylase RimI-like enzyme